MSITVLSEYKLSDGLYFEGFTLGQTDGKSRTHPLSNFYADRYSFSGIWYGDVAS